MAQRDQAVLGLFSPARARASADSLVEVRFWAELWWEKGLGPCLLRGCLELASSSEVAPVEHYIGQHDMVLDAGRAWMQRRADLS